MKSNVFITIICDHHVYTVSYSNCITGPSNDMWSQYFSVHHSHQQCCISFHCAGRLCHFSTKKWYLENFALQKMMPLSILTLFSNPSVILSTILASRWLTSTIIRPILLIDPLCHPVFISIKPDQFDRR